MAALILTLPPGFGEVPCDLCGERVMADFLERAPECCARERWCCEGCLEVLEAKRRAEEEIEAFDRGQRWDEMGVM